MTSKYKFREFVCVGCGRSVKKLCPAKSRYCSLDCYRSTPRPARKTGTETTCGHCRAKIYVRKSEARGLNFCSKRCHDEHQSRNKTSHLCLICGKEFKWSPSRTKLQNPTYCSIACRNKCPEWKRKSVIAANLKQQHSKAPNRLELAGREILSEIGLPFSEQVLIAEKFVVDAVLTGTSIVIQWDGDYWHGYNADRLDSRQQKRVALDKSQDAYMTKLGYTVLRFWEHEVFQQKEIVRENIASAIQHAAS